MHRDINHKNILLDFEEPIKAYLSDFGHAKYFTTNLNSTDRAMSVCYVNERHYRAPEILLGNNRYDQKVDIWSLGNELIY